MPVRIAKTAIINLAQQNVGRSTELNTICDDRLNLIVNQLYENYTWNTHDTSSNITLSTGTPNWTVPTNYLKSGYGKLIIPGTDPATEITLPILSYENYGLLNTPVSPGRPQVLAVKRILDSQGIISLTGYVWPQPDQGYTAKLYFKAIQDYDITDTDAPAFFDLKSLVELLTNELRGMGYGTEQGIPYDPQLLDKILGRMRRNMTDEGIYPHRAKLDQRIFRRIRTVNDRRYTV